MMEGAIVRQILVNLHELQVHLDAVERPLARLRGKVSNRSAVFPHGILVALLELGNRSADCVQPIIAGVDSRGSLDQ